MAKPILVFQTDFTYKEGAVCAMYGVVKSVDPALEIIDGTHQIPHFDTWSASYRLYQFMRFWPKGTIFVSVVDPGVGTKRKACVAKTKDGYYIVTPDNGSLTHPKVYHGIEEIREIDETKNRLKSTLATGVFHGRDLFAYCAAKLAGGIISFEEVGPPYPQSQIISHEISRPLVTSSYAQGIIEICDPNFGNIWTNIPSNEFLQKGFSYGDLVGVSVSFRDRKVFEGNVPFQISFGWAKESEPILYTNELMNLALGLNMDNFRKKYQVGFGNDWTIKIAKNTDSILI